MEHPNLPDWLQTTEELVQIIEITGWTPDVIEVQPAHLLDRVRHVGMIHRSASEERQAQNIAAALGG